MTCGVGLSNLARPKRVRHRYYIAKSVYWLVSESQPPTKSSIYCLPSLIQTIGWRFSGGADFLKPCEYFFYASGGASNPHKTLPQGPPLEMLRPFWGQARPLWALKGFIGFPMEPSQTSNRHRTDKSDIIIGRILIERVMIELITQPYFFFFITLGLELSDTKVYEP